MADQEVGKVTHYFDKAMVALMKLSGSLKTGDSIKVVKGEDVFEMEVSSMQVNHESISEGKSGEEVAVKVPNHTKEGAVIYKAEK